MLAIARIYRDSLPDTPQFPKPSAFSLIRRQLRCKRKHFPPLV